MPNIITAPRVVVSVQATVSGDLQVVSTPTGFAGITSANFADNDIVAGFLLHENGEDWEEYDDADGSGNNTLEIQNVSGTVVITRPSSPYKSSNGGSRVDLGSGTHTLALAYGSATLQRIYYQLNPEWKTFTSGDSSPDVSGYQHFKTAGTTAIARFDNMETGKIFRVARGDSDIAITNSANIVLVGGADITLTAANPVAIFAEQSGVAVHIGGNAGVLPLAGGTMVGDITLAGDPDAALKAVTKQYVDNTIAGRVWKDAVLCRTTANITLSGEQTLDGVTTNASRVLVANQTSPAENGIYVSDPSGWSRSTDMDAWAEVPNAAVLVEQGSTYADTAWVCTADAGGTLGSTSITWTQFGAQAASDITVEDSALRVTAANSQRALDLIAAIGAGVVISSTTDAQPGSPSQGDAYIITGAASGADWAGFSENDVAVYCSDAIWINFAPWKGLRLYDQTAEELLEFDGSVWGASSTGSGTVASVSALKGVAAAQRDTTLIYYVLEDGKRGSFRWLSGDQTAKTTRAGPTSSSIAANVFTTAANHGLNTATAVFTASAVNGLSANTPYYVIWLSKTTFSVAATISDAYAGTAVALSGTTATTFTVLIDPGEGIFVVPNDAAFDGSEGVFERIWNGSHALPGWWGFAADNTEATAAANTLALRQAMATCCTVGLISGINVPLLPPAGVGYINGRVKWDTGVIGPGNRGWILRAASTWADAVTTAGGRLLMWDFYSHALSRGILDGVAFDCNNVDNLAAWGSSDQTEPAGAYEGRIGDILFLNCKTYAIDSGGVAAGGSGMLTGAYIKSVTFSNCAMWMTTHDSTDDLRIADMRGSMGTNAPSDYILGGNAKNLKIGTLFMGSLSVASTQTGNKAPIGFGAGIQAIDNVFFENSGGGTANWEYLFDNTNPKGMLNVRQVMINMVAQGTEVAMMHANADSTNGNVYSINVGQVVSTGSHGSPFTKLLGVNSDGASTPGGSMIECIFDGLTYGTSGALFDDFPFVVDDSAGAQTVQPLYIRGHHAGVNYDHYVTPLEALQRVPEAGSDGSPVKQSFSISKTTNYNLASYDVAVFRVPVNLETGDTLLVDVTADLNIAVVKSDDDTVYSFMSIPVSIRLAWIQQSGGLALVGSELTSGSASFGADSAADNAFDYKQFMSGLTQSGYSLAIDTSSVGRPALQVTHSYSTATNLTDARLTLAGEARIATQVGLRHATSGDFFGALNIY